MSTVSPPRDDLLWQQVHWLGAIAAQGSLTAAAQRLGCPRRR
jgi:transcriptional regulator, LysR family